MGLIRGFQYQRDGIRQPLPVRSFAFQLLAARARELVELCLSTGVGAAPLSLQPAAFFEPVQRWIERSLLNVQRVARHLFQPLRNRVAVQWAEGDDLEDEEVERALQQVGLA